MHWVKKVVGVILTSTIILLVTTLPAWLLFPKARNDAVLPTSPTTSSSLSDNICLTNKCYWLARRITSVLNEKVDPCDNFYDFACGDWIRNNQDIEGEWDQRQELNSVISQKMLGFKDHTKVSLSFTFYSDVSGIIKSVVDVSDPIPVKAAKQFFQYCMADDWSKEKQLKILSEKYTKNISLETQELSDVLGDISRDLATDTIFFIGISYDKRNYSSQDRVVYIDNFYHDQIRVVILEREKENRKITTFIENVWQLIFPNSSSRDAKRIAKEIYAFERQLFEVLKYIIFNQKISTVPDDDDDIHKMEYYHFLTIPELNNLTRNTNIIDWQRFFYVFFKGGRRNLMANLETFKVAVGDLQFFKKIGNLLKKTFKKSPHVIGKTQ